MLIKAKSLVDCVIDDIARTFLTDKAADRVWLSVDLRFLLMAAECPHTAAESCVEYFLSGMGEAAGDKRTILVSTFNFDFPKTKIFDAHMYPCSNRSFRKLFTEKHARKRMIHPFYSFLAFGKEATELTKNASKIALEKIQYWVGW